MQTAAKARPEAAAAKQEDSFTIYMAKQFIARKGYKQGTVPEARELQNISDIVLTFMNGISFRIACFIDRDKNSGKFFNPDPVMLENIIQRCQKYTGKIQRQKMPVEIMFFEVSSGPVSAANRDRLKSLKKCVSSPYKFQILPWAVDAKNRTAWSAFGYHYSQWFVKKIAKARDGLNVAILPQARFRTSATPFTTFILLAAFVAAFIAEIAYIPSHDIEPNARMLALAGGMSPGLVLQQKEWFRLLTAGFLHGSILHLFINGLVIFLLGRALEHMIGSAWQYATFIFGVAGGSLMGLLVNPANIVSVGASGGVMALLSCMLVCSLRMSPASTARFQLQTAAFQFLIPSLLPIAHISAISDFSGNHVDYAAHFGGAIVGCIIGAFLLTFWKREKELPPFGLAAAVLAIAATLLSGFGFLHFMMYKT